MAGAVGFEPTRPETKTQCLTAWLHPNISKIIKLWKKGPAATYSPTSLPMQYHRRWRT